MEESQRQQRMCRELRDKHALQAVLRRAHDHAMDAYAAHEDEDEFRELLDPPRILGECKQGPPSSARVGCVRELGSEAGQAAQATSPRNRSSRPSFQA